MRKLKSVQFVSVVSFGGQLQSAGLGVVGDRPGQVPMQIEGDLEAGYITLTKVVNGQLQSRLVPMSNVASFELLPEAKETSKK